MLAGTRTIGIGYEITVENHRSGKARVSVHDHIPLSTDGVPPTAQNLAKLTVPIPAGFRHVSLVQAVTPSLKQFRSRQLAQHILFCRSPGGPAAMTGRAFQSRLRSALPVFPLTISRPGFRDLRPGDC